jgi:outer membrane protein assembly factor BamB
MPFDPIINSSIVAFDVNTGEEKWRYFMDGYGFRGGVIVSGGIVWFAAVDGWARGLDADTGEVIYEHNIGSSAVVQPTIAADADGNMKIFRVIGGRAIRGMGSSQPGAIMAYGLPDTLPEPVIVEVEVERIVEVEVVKEVEVIKEVEVTVTEEVISPISYVAIGLGVILVVVAGVLYSRTRNA